MKSERTWMVLALSCMVLLGGCVRIEIGDKAAAATLGAQLIDLERAHQEGVITEQELGELRRDLIRAVAD